MFGLTYFNINVTTRMLVLTLVSFCFVWLALKPRTARFVSLFLYFPVYAAMLMVCLVLSIPLYVILYVLGPMLAPIAAAALTILLVTHTEDDTALRRRVRLNFAIAEGVAAAVAALSFQWR